MKIQVQKQQKQGVCVCKNAHHAKNMPEKQWGIIFIVEYQSNNLFLIAKKAWKSPYYMPEMAQSHT